MAYPIYTVRLGGGTAQANELLVLHTAMENFTTVVRDVTVYNAGQASNPIFVHIHAGSEYIPIAKTDLDVEEVLHYEGRQVLEPGDQLVVIGIDGPIRSLATGYLFQHPNVPLRQRSVTSASQDVPNT